MGISHYDCNLGEFAKYMLANIKETPYTKEIINSWRGCAVTENVNQLYNTPE